MFGNKNCTKTTKRMFTIKICYKRNKTYPRMKIVPYVAFYDLVSNTAYWPVGPIVVLNGLEWSCGLSLPFDGI